MGPLLTSPRRAAPLLQPVQEQLRDVLTANAVRVIDLFREWDEDQDGTVSKKEFRRAMPLLGLEVPRAEVDALFDSWDPDGSGSLEIPELNKVLRRGAEVSPDKMPHPAPQSPPPNLDHPSPKPKPSPLTLTLIR